MLKFTLAGIIEFDWDEANISHIEIHNVSPKEAENIFFDKNNVTFEDLKHSYSEPRFVIIGKSDKRILYQIFTVRGNKIRVISSRDLNRKEVKLYEKKVDNSKIYK